MPQFLKQCGAFGMPLILLGITTFILILVAIARLRTLRPETAPRTVQGIHAILFWGAVSAVLGFLGQHTGLYNALGAIGRAREISPQVVARGFAESFTTTIFGMTILVISALAWFGLLAWYRKRATAWEPPETAPPTQSAADR